MVYRLLSVTDINMNKETSFELGNISVLEARQDAVLTPAAAF